MQFYQMLYSVSWTGKTEIVLFLCQSIHGAERMKERENTKVSDFIRASDSLTKIMKHGPHQRLGKVLRNNSFQQPIVGGPNYDLHFE